MREFSASFIEKKALVFKFWLETSEKEGYDQLTVWRSTAGEGGPYTELTGDTWGPAMLSGRRIPGALVGTTLELLVGEKAVAVTFTGTEPLSLGDVAAQIEYQGAGLLQAIADSPNSVLELYTANVGCVARLEVTGGSAAPILGFSVIPPTNRAYGTDARLRLTSTNSYSFEDSWCKPGYFYKTRLRRSWDSTVSEFSFPITGNPTRAVTPDRLVAGWIRIVDFQGRPVANRSVMISTKDTIHSLAIDNLVVDFNDQQLYTDANGYCSLLLLRGVMVAVGIAGTSLVRDVTPPVDPTVESFNLFDPSVGTDDAFSVQVPNINLAERQEC